MEAACEVRERICCMNDKIKIRKCTLDDVPQLALLNKQLIDDEKSHNSMNVNELEERMHEFITTEYDAYFFINKENVVGYALVKNTCNPLYLRQFLIEREYRMMHYGTSAFRCLMEHLNVDSIDIEVLPWNEPGIRFWESLGFHEVSRYLRFKRSI